MQKLTLKHYFWLTILTWIAFYYGLGSYPLADNNEGLYAEIAREMWLSKSFIIPQLNFFPYIEKPPLLYWLTSLSYALFGITEFAARLIPATSGALSCLGLLYFGQRIYKDTNYEGTYAGEAWLASLILASSLGFVIISRILFFDMLLTACLCFCLLNFYVWYQQDRKQNLLYAYACLGLAVLTKGFLCLVLVPIISISFLLYQRAGWKKISALFTGQGIALFLLIILPWHIFACLSDTNFAWDYFINEQVLRFLDKRIPRDYYMGSIYYYLPRILAYLFPWSFFLPLLAMRTTKKTNDFLILLWLWFIIPLIFFSLSKAKANYYMIIAMPALAMLLAIKLQAISARVMRGSGILFFICLVIATSVVFKIAATKYLPFDQHHVLNAQLNYFLLTTIAMALVAIFYLLLKQGSQIFVYSFISLVASLGTYVLISLAPQAEELYSQRQVAIWVKKHYPNNSVYLFQDFENISSLPFYLGQRVTMIDNQSNDLYNAKKRYPNSQWFINSSSFNDLLEQRSSNIIVLTRIEKLPELRRSLISLKLIQSFKTIAVLKN